MTLRVTLSIVPFGEEDKERVIEVINISNLGQLQGNNCIYVVEKNSYKEYEEGTPRVLHDRDDGAIWLAAKALEKCYA